MKKAKHEYRKRYFEQYPPDRKGLYQCVYCGRKYPQKWITIDHIIPRKKLRDARNLMFILIFLSIAVFLLMRELGKETYFLYPIAGGIFSLLFLFFFSNLEHSMMNLAAACFSCNQKKSAHIDFRIVLAMFTKHRFFRKLFFFYR